MSKRQTDENGKLIGYTEVPTDNRCLDLLREEGFEIDVVYTGPSRRTYYFNQGKTNIASWNSDIGNMSILPRRDAIVDTPDALIINDFRPKYPETTIAESMRQIMNKLGS